MRPLMHRGPLWLLCLALLTTTCSPSPSDVSLPERTVAIQDCLEPYHGWIVSQLKTNAALGPAWRLANAGETAEVTIHCGDAGEPGRGGGYQLGSHQIVIDPNVVTRSGIPEFSFRAATGHELVHDYLDANSPHPETARLHICWFAYNDRPPPDCHPTIVAKDALMSPGIGGANPWSGNYESLGEGGLGQYEPTADDKAFFRLAMTR